MFNRKINKNNKQTKTIVEESLDLRNFINEYRQQTTAVKLHNVATTNITTRTTKCSYYIGSKSNIFNYPKYIISITDYNEYYIISQNKKRINVHFRKSILT